MNKTFRYGIAITLACASAIAAGACRGNAESTASSEQPQNHQPRRGLRRAAHNLARPAEAL